MPTPSATTETGRAGAGTPPRSDRAGGLTGVSGTVDRVCVSDEGSKEYATVILRDISVDQLLVKDTGLALSRSVALVGSGASGSGSGILGNASTTRQERLRRRADCKSEFDHLHIEVSPDLAFAVQTPRSHSYKLLSSKALVLVPMLVVMLLQLRSPLNGS
jgi:hypothetical protein